MNNPVTIYVRILTDFSFAVELLPSSSVGDLKTFIAARWSIPVTQQHMTYRSVVMDSSRTLQSYGVEEDGTVSVIPAIDHSRADDGHPIPTEWPMVRLMTDLDRVKRRIRLELQNMPAANPPLVSADGKIRLDLLGAPHRAQILPLLQQIFAAGGL